MMPSESYKVFSSLGGQRFQEMIHDQEAESAAPVVETKAITVRLDAYKVEAIDSVARAVGLNRQDFVSMLLDAAIGDAAEGFSHGFGENFSDFHPEHAAIHWVRQLEDLSPSAHVYLSNALMRSLGLEESHA